MQQFRFLPMKNSCVLAILILSGVFHTQAQEKFITLGSGGGFAGTTTVYKITEKGEVFKGKGLGEIVYTECGKIKRSQAKKFFKNVSAQLQAADFNHPGNLYYFLTIAENGNEKKVTWGDADHKVPEPIRTTHQEIQATVTPIKFKPIHPQ